MKLRNKLIPLVATATLASSVAPLAACGNVSTSSMNMIDVLNGYVPTVDRAEGATNLSEKQVEDLYIEDVKKNNDIFVQDLAWWEGMALKTRLSKAANYLSFDASEKYGLITGSKEGLPITMIPRVANFGVSDIKINEVTLVNPTTLQDQKIHTISLKFNYEYEYDLVADAYYGINRYTINRTVKTSLTSEYKNMPFSVEYDSNYDSFIVETTGWKEPNRWMLAKLTDWSFNFDFKSYTTDTVNDYEKNVDTYSYDNSMNGYIDTLAKVNAWIPLIASTVGNESNSYQEPTTDSYDDAVRLVTFHFGSYHLYDIMGPRWATDSFGYCALNVDSYYGDPSWTPNDEGITNCSFYWSTDWWFNDQYCDGSYVGIGSMVYNYSYMEQYSKIYPIAAKLNIKENIVMPVYSRRTPTPEGEEPTPVYKLVIKASENTNMRYDDDETCVRRFGVVARLYDIADEKLENPVPINEMVFNDGNPGVNFLNDYYWTFPKGNLPITFTMVDESKVDTYIPIEKDTVMPWSNSRIINPGR